MEDLETVLVIVTVVKVLGTSKAVKRQKFLRQIMKNLILIVNMMIIAIAAYPEKVLYLILLLKVQLRHYQIKMELCNNLTFTLLIANKIQNKK